MERIAIAGTGRLARSLARSFADRIVAIVGRDIDASRAVAALGRAAVAYGTGELPADISLDLVWIATRDEAISEVAASLAASRESWRGVTVVHSAGALGTDVLAPFTGRGADAIALHPNASLRGDAPIESGTIWGLTPPTEAAMTLARSVLSSIDGRVIPVREEMRPLYHAAASTASNFSVTLFAIAERLYERAGVERGVARELVAAFMLTSFERCRRDGPQSAITGPIVRGDEAIVAAQREAVARYAAEVLAAFDALADSTRSLLTDVRQP